MPRFFRAWLKTLDKKQAKAMWNYFDGSRYVCEDVTEIVAPLAGWKPVKDHMGKAIDYKPE